MYYLNKNNKINLRVLPEKGPPVDIKLVFNKIGGGGKTGWAGGGEGILY